MNMNKELTKKQKELLDILEQEPSGRLTNAMGCFLLETSPQAYGKIVRALQAKGLAYRYNDQVWPCSFGE
jgi:hypothetical protein